MKTEISKLMSRLILTVTGHHPQYCLHDSATEINLLVRIIICLRPVWGSLVKATLANDLYILKLQYRFLVSSIILFLNHDFRHFIATPIYLIYSIWSIIHSSCAAYY